MTPIERIVESRNYKNMIAYSESPKPDEYVITGLQQGNNDPNDYLGYVVQIRKGVGEFGSDIVLIRHPNGKLGRHENQAYFRMEERWINELKKLYPKGSSKNPEEDEDYSQPYTLGGKYPKTGRIIEPNDNHPEPDNNPMVK